MVFIALLTNYEPTTFYREETVPSITALNVYQSWRKTTGRSAADSPVRLDRPVAHFAAPAFARHSTLE